MKLVAEYLADAAKFERMAEEQNDPDVKAAMKKQAAAYRKLAVERANRMGIPPPDIPSK
jgi:hypothetical protein